MLCCLESDVLANSKIPVLQVLWRAPFDAVAANWTKWTVMANLSNAAPHPPTHGGGQGQTHPLMDVELPKTGAFAAAAAAGQKLVVTLVSSILLYPNRSHAKRIQPSSIHQTHRGYGWPLPSTATLHPHPTPRSARTRNASLNSFCHGSNVDSFWLLAQDANNNQNYSRFHLGSARWDPGAPLGNHSAPTDWAWTAMPGGKWETTPCNVSAGTPDGYNTLDDFDITLTLSHPARFVAACFRQHCHPRATPLCLACAA